MENSGLSMFILLLLRCSTVTTGSEVPSAEVEIMQNGTAIAGETSFSLSCCVTLPQGIQDEEELTIEILMPVTINDTDNSVNRINGSVIDGSCTYTSVLRFTILKTSHGGKYICIVTFNSSTIASTTTTVNIQIPIPLLTMSRDPDDSVTLHHGDHLNLTCTITLDPAVDIDVTVTGTLSGKGILNPIFDTVKHIPSIVYQINRTITSLEATRSAVYTCNATVFPGPVVVNVEASGKACSVLNITVELNVIISVSYNPPSDAVLGPNEYRAASGPVTVTCTAIGGTGSIGYRWSSNCRNCPFQDATSRTITRGAVHSGDTGTHICTATAVTADIVGSASINFTVKGAGIHVFNGVPRGSLQSNELVVSDDSDPKFHLRFFCRSDSMSSNAGELIGLHNSTLTSSHPLNISTPQPGELLVFVDNHTRLTPSHQGVYTCHISMENEDIKNINIGIYPSGFRGAPTVASVFYRSERSSSDLTCNSITSPPTTVTWVLADAMFTLRDGESVTINRVKYELKQTITNRTTSVYASTLTINTTLVGNTTEYRCTVNNTLGSDSKTVGEGTFSISIFPSGTQTAGENYTLTCSIAVAKGVVDTLTAHWLGPGVHMDGVTATNVSTQILGDSSTFTLDLTFTPLRQSHDGDYTCTAALATFTDSSDTKVLTTVPLVEVHISGGGVVKFGESVALNCAISGVDNLDGIITFQWRGPNRTILESASPRFELSTVSFSDAGIYTCTATVSSPYLNEDILESDTVNVIVQVPSPKVAIEHNSRSAINAGSVLVLSCTISVDRRVAQIKQLIVTNTWTGPHGELQNETRITVVQAHGTSGQYCNNVTFNRTHVSDSGNYSCQSNVSHQASQFIIQGMNASVTTIAVQAPNVSLSLTPNTTRLPNVLPYNTFSLTCTATVPEGVVSPKTFTWWRRNAVTNNNLAQIHHSETIQIINSALDQPMSTSVLTVTETAAGTYHFQCRVDLVELGVHDMSNEYSISVTSFSLSTIITGENNSLAAEKYTLTCVVTVTEGIPDNLTAHWSGPGVGMDGVTASNISTETQADGSTSSSNLTFNPLRQSHDGNYNCTASLTTVSISNSSLRTISATTPSVIVMTSSTSNVVLGERYFLNCTVSGADHLDGTIVIEWSNSSNHTVASGTGKHLQLLLMKLKLSDAGQYTCNTTVTSPYIQNEIIVESVETLFVAIPRPTVITGHDGGSNVYAGSVLILTCTITLDGLVAQNEALIVNNIWTGRSNETITSTARIAVTYPSSTSAQYLSTIKFQTLRERDTGIYSCWATVSHKSIQYVQDGTSANSTTLNVQAPRVVLTLISDTTRLPNVHPYNTFSLTCTATVPQGVVSPKTFTWWRQNAVMNNNLAQIHPDETIQITNSALDQPMSTSVLTVTETAEGTYHFQCQVDLEELGVKNMSNEYSISITRFFTTPTVSVTPVGNDLIIAGSSLILICAIHFDRVLVDLINITVNSTWTGPHGKLFLDSSHNERIIVTDATKSADGSYRSTMVITPLHMSDTGSYSCEAGVSHMSEFTSFSDLGKSNRMINVKAPDVTVIGIVNPMNGSVIAGKLFSITCMIIGADNLKAKFNFTLIAEDNNTVLHHEENTINTHLIHNFTAIASDAVVYLCKVTVTSTFLDEPIISNTTITLTIQSKSDTNATITGLVVGVTLLALLVIAIVVASIILKGRKHCEELTTIDLAKHKAASKEDIHTSECAAYHQVEHHLGSTTDEQPHATDTAQQNPVYENAQPQTVESPTEHVYEIISQV